MSETSSDVKQGLLWRQEHLAPLPIPTGQPASDLMNIIWRKNQTYLDIGDFAMGAGWLTLHSMTFLFLAISIWLAIDSYDSPVANWVDFSLAPVGGAMIMIPLWYFFIKQWRKPLTPPIRFNRQRREVCITKPDGEYWFVPWERVHAIAPSAISLNTGGASKHGSLILWFPLKDQLDETYAPNKEGWIMMVNPGGGISSMAQWECIRSFMEVGPKAVPEPSVTRNKGMTLWQSLTHDITKAAKTRGWFLAVLWEGLICTFVFNLILAEYFFRKKLAHLPDLTAPEAIEWSKPIPQEQWAKRSPELEQAIAEREAQLAAQA